jgi:hypothetical protein
MLRHIGLRLGPDATAVYVRTAGDYYTHCRSICGVDVAAAQAHRDCFDAPQVYQETKADTKEEWRRRSSVAIRVRTSVDHVDHFVAFKAGYSEKQSWMA